MKKFIVLLLCSLFVLAGCTQSKSNDCSCEENNDQKTNTTKNESVESDNNDIQQTTDTSATQSFDQSQYVIDTFASYGYTAPSEDQWEVIAEGEHKITVIIKIRRERNSPLVSKLVFLPNSGEPELIFVMVENHVKYTKH